MFSLKKKIKKALADVDVLIDGARDWDIQVHDERLYRRVIARGSVGLGESYMDGWWDCKKLDEFFSRALRARIDKKIFIKWERAMLAVSNIIFNMQSARRAFHVGERHYDIGDDLYKAMLDKRMVYSCGYWNPSTNSGLKTAKTLDEAQENKLDLICKKLGLKTGQKVLDIGCGWGSFAKFAAEKYGVHVTGITISKKQAALGKKLTKNLPVDIMLLDYRKIEGVFDRIVSVGMFEHVGHKNYRTFMKIVSKRMKDDGIFLLHTIGGSYSTIGTDPWIEKYIFPNGEIPSIKYIGEAIEKIFVVEDWHNFGADYDKTLMAWQKNFEANWGKLSDRYSERFRRMWNYYLLSCAGVFRARNNQLWQIVLTKNGLHGGYKSIR